MPKSLHYRFRTETGFAPTTVVGASSTVFVDLTDTTRRSLAATSTHFGRKALGYWEPFERVGAEFVAPREARAVGCWHEHVLAHRALLAPALARDPDRELPPAGTKLGGDSVQKRLWGGSAMVVVSSKGATGGDYAKEDKAKVLFDGYTFLDHGKPAKQGLPRTPPNPHAARIADLLAAESFYKKQDIDAKKRVDPKYAALTALVCELRTCPSMNPAQQHVLDYVDIAADVLQRIAIVALVNTSSSSVGQRSCPTSFTRLHAVCRQILEEARAPQGRLAGAKPSGDEIVKQAFGGGPFAATVDAFRRQVLQRLGERESPYASLVTSDDVFKGKMRLHTIDQVMRPRVRYEVNANGLLERRVVDAAERRAGPAASRPDEIPWFSFQRAIDVDEHADFSDRFEQLDFGKPSRARNVDVDPTYARRFSTYGGPSAAPPNLGALVDAPLVNTTVYKYVLSVLARAAKPSHWSAEKFKRRDTRNLWSIVHQLVHIHWRLYANHARHGDMHMGNVKVIVVNDAAVDAPAAHGPAVRDHAVNDPEGMSGVVVKVFDFGKAKFESGPNAYSYDDLEYLLQRKAVSGLLETRKRHKREIADIEAGRPLAERRDHKHYAIHQILLAIALRNRHARLWSMSGVDFELGYESSSFFETPADEVRVRKKIQEFVSSVGDPFLAHLKANEPAESKSAREREREEAAAKAAFTVFANTLVQRYYEEFAPGDGDWIAAG